MVSSMLAHGRQPRPRRVDSAATVPVVLGSMPTIRDPDLDTARGLIEGALGDLLAVGDDGLEAPWTWPDHGELDRRSGFFRIIEDVGATVAGIESRVARPTDQAIVAPATVARWEL